MPPSLPERAAEREPDANALTIDPLFVAVTRPAMAWGVTYSALLVIAMLTLEAFLVSRNLLALLGFVPLHALAWLLCALEPRFVDLLAAWGRTRAVGLSALAQWGAQSYGALPVALPDPASGRRRGARRQGVSVRGSLLA